MKTLTRPHHFEMDVPLVPNMPQTELRLKMDGKPVENLKSVQMHSGVGDDVTSVHLTFQGLATLEAVAQTTIAVDFTYEERRQLGELLAGYLRKGGDTHDWDDMGKLAESMFTEVFSWRIGAGAEDGQANG
ncbi:hypothetical protein NVP2117O_21 [Vibrio phage 2.117.O._10N.261.45.E9]|nr:hypothetical protein NVP1117O_21 [Vibrio phage 1.117.O._10N.261.45.E9]AUR95422.1 hypothetical protein NVP1207B_15 [Vibrio phage 1.207.B._10N.222.51.C2]AUS02313.1 hypothetical protein NVP2117O_21 [Vibrio phage 2.117.O._10N.261.45.E9]